MDFQISPLAAAVKQYFVDDLNQARNSTLTFKESSEYDALMSHPNVVSFAKELRVYKGLASNLDKVREEIAAFSKVYAERVFNKISSLDSAVYQLSCDLEHSYAASLGDTLSSIPSGDASLEFHPFFLLTSRVYTPLLSILTSATVCYKPTVAAFTGNSAVNDGSELVSLVSDIHDALEQKDISKVLAVADEAIDLVKAYKKALEDADYYAFLFYKTLDLLVSTAVDKLLDILEHTSDSNSFGVFMTPLLNFITKSKGLTKDSLFLRTGRVFSDNVTTEELAAIYNSAMDEFVKVLDDVGFAPFIEHFENPYYTISFKADVLTSFVKDFGDLFRKGRKSSYDSSLFVPSMYLEDKTPTSFITNSASDKEINCGILGTHFYKTFDYAPLQNFAVLFKNVVDAKERAKAKGDLTISKVKVYDHTTQQYEEREVYNFTCSKDVVAKYEAEFYNNGFLSILTNPSLKASNSNNIACFYDLVGRLYYKTSNTMLNPMNNKVSRELIRDYYNIGTLSGIVFKDQFESGELCWLDPDFVKDLTIEESLTKLRDTVTYPIFASFSNVLGVKVTDVKDTHQVFDVVEEFFAPALDGMSLAHLDTYTNKMGDKLISFLQGLANTCEIDGEVCAEAYKFIQVMFFELPTATCSYTVAYDATSSVFQFLSMYCGDTNLMKACNVMPTEGVTGAQDIYLSITREFLSFKANKYNDPSLLADDELLRKERELIKKALMTYVYGSPVRFIEFYGKEGLSDFEEFLAEKYPTLAHVIKVFQDLWYDRNLKKYTYNKGATYLGRKHQYEVIMPDGFDFTYIPTSPVEGYCPDYAKLKFVVAKVGYDLYNPNFKYQDNIKRKSSDKGFAANLVHAEDALTLREITFMCEALPRFYPLIALGFCSKVYQQPDLMGVDAISKQVGQYISEGYSVSLSGISPEEAKKLYFRVRNNKYLFEKCEYIVEHKDELINSLVQSRFVSSLWTLVFAGIALNRLGEILGEECEVFAKLAEIGEDFSSLLFNYSLRGEGAEADDNFLLFINQFLNTLAVIPSEVIRLITIHDSFHVLPKYSNALYNIARLQYAKIGGSNLFEYMLSSFFGDEFVSKVGLSFLTSAEKDKISDEIYNAQFILTN